MYLLTNVNFDFENYTFSHCSGQEIAHENEFYYVLKEWRFCPRCGCEHTFEIEKTKAKALLKDAILKTPELKEYIDDYLNGDDEEPYYYGLMVDFLENGDLIKVICQNDELFNNLVDEIVAELKVNDGVKKMKMNNNNILEALNSAESALLGFTGDVISDKRLAWVYGILIGWNSESLKEYAQIHNIKQSDIERLKKYRNCYSLFKKNIKRLNDD